MTHIVLINQINNLHTSIVNLNCRDMAVLVEKQNEPIKAIAEAADNAHQRTKEGLVQVNKAAEYQPGCVLC